MLGVDRIVSQVMAFVAGRHDEVIAWLERLDCKVVTRPGENGSGHWTIDGLHGIRCGLCAGLDPIAVTAQVGFLLLGQLWPLALPELIPAVNRAWDQQRKERLAARRKT